MTLTIADYCMKEPLMRLWKQFPNLRLRLTVQNTDVLLDQIQCGQLDLAIVEGYVPKEAFDHALFQTQEYIAVCHPDHVFSREVRSLQDLCGEPLFIREPGSGTRAVLEHALSMQELSLQDFLIVGEIGSLHTIKQCVLADLGLAFFYRPVVERELRDGRLRQVPLRERITHTFSFVWAKDSMFAEPYRTLCALLCEPCKE